MFQPVVHNMDTLHQISVASEVEMSNTRLYDVVLYAQVFQERVAIDCANSGVCVVVEAITRVTDLSDSCDYNRVAPV